MCALCRVFCVLITFPSSLAVHEQPRLSSFDLSGASSPSASASRDYMRSNPSDRPMRPITHDDHKYAASPGPSGGAAAAALSPRSSVSGGSGGDRSSRHSRAANGGSAGSGSAFMAVGGFDAASGTGFSSATSPRERGASAISPRSSGGSSANTILPVSATSAGYSASPVAAAAASAPNNALNNAPNKPSYKVSTIRKSRK